jgi:PKD repeat protein
MAGTNFLVGCGKYTKPEAEHDRLHEYVVGAAKFPSPFFRVEMRITLTDIAQYFLVYGNTGKHLVLQSVRINLSSWQITLTMKKRAFPVFLIVLTSICSHLTAQKNLTLDALPVQTAAKTEVLKQVEQYELFELNAKAMLAFAQSNGQATFELRIRLGSAHDWDIVLQPAKVHGNDFRFILNTGEEVNVEKNITYQGYLKNDPATKVRMTISDNYIHGQILDAEQHVFETVNRTPTRSANDLVVVYKNRALNAKSPACGHAPTATDTQKKGASDVLPLTLPDGLPAGSPLQSAVSSSTAQIQATNTYCPKLGITLDWQGLAKAGSVANFNADIQTILNIVNGYYDDFSVQYELNPVFVIPASPNPWQDESPGNHSTLVNNFSQWAFPNLTPKNYNCALLFTGTDMNGIGYAYYGHMCIDDDHRYGEIDYLYPQPITQRANLTAHELGHLWDARHTPSTSSVYIMSGTIYNGTLQWDATAINVITSSVNSTFNSCLPNCSNLAVDWSSPSNGQIITSLNPINLSATASADGTITKVEFFVNDVSVGVDNSSPYALNWTPPAYANYALKVVATDNLGVSTTKQISITVKDPTIIDITIQVNAGSDDAEETVSTGYMDLSSSDLELVYDGSTKPQQVGIRFKNFNLPAGANIVDAHIQFTVDETDSGAMALTVYGEKQGNPTAFTSTAYNISSRTKTNASVAWAPAPWTVLQDAGVNQRTPNLSSIVQEISSRPDWSANNAMVFIITGSGERTAEAFEGSASEAPVLHISYTLNPLPVADFSANEPITAPGSTVQFTSSASGANLSYQWTFEGGSPSSSTATNPSVTYNTPGSYNVTLTVGNANGTNTMVKANYIIVDQFCIATGSATTGNDYISNVLVGAINKTSGKSRYSSFTDVMTTVEKGSSYPIEITLNTSFSSDTVYAWADWNNNKVLESSEAISMSALNAAHKSTGTITVPASAVNGSIRLRVRNIKGTAGALPCGDYEGEVEDYTLHVTEVVAPNTPTGLLATNITNSSATLSWNASAGATGYNLKIRIADSTWTTFSTTSTTFSAATLSAGTTYEWQVQAYNVAGTSSYSTAAFFTTCQSNCSDLLVSWTNPADGQVFTNLNPVSFAANATADGSITQVEFFVNNVSIGIDNTSPYTLSWTPPAYANYALKATATDNLGNTSSKQIGIGIQNGAVVNITSQVNAGSDDAEQSVSSGSMYLTSTDLELVYDGSTNQQQVGLRFKNINIPAGATITNTYIQFTVDETSSASVGLTIYGQNHGNPTTFTTSTNNISSRAKTTSSVSWIPAPWTVVGEAGVNQRTPDLSSIVQGIIDRPDWSANNAMAFIITGSGYRTAEAYEGSTTKAPKLLLSYVTNNVPIANFTASETTVAPGSTVQFTSISSGLAISHQWTFEGGTPLVSTATNPSVVYNAPGTYKVTLVVSNASGSDTLVQDTFISVGYCLATGKAGTGDDYITNVQVGSINNTSGKTSYSNFAGMVSTVEKSNSYPLTVTLNNAFAPDNVYAWADWNNNMVFESSELIPMSTLNANDASTGTITVPETAVNSTIRLRIRNIYGTDGAQPCGNYWGEVEDYTLNVTGVGVLYTPGGLLTSGITDSSATLSWNTSSGATGYDVQIRPLNGSWSTFSTTNASYIVQNLDAGGFYEWQVRAINTTDTTSYAPIESFSTLLSAITYCPSMGNNPTFEWIANVDVGAFSNSSGSAGYTDFTDSTITMAVGATYALGLTPGFSASSYNEYWNVWIDLNGDGTFGAEDLLFDPGSLSNTTVTGTISVPAGTTPLTTRMRVSMKYNSAPSPCAVFSYGEVEDYTVQIVPPLNNLPATPAGLAATAITVSSTTLSWGAVGGATGYTIQIRPQGGAWSTFSSTTTSHNASSLSANTVYEWQVKATNAAGASSYSPIATFSTLTTSSYCASEGSNASYEWIAKVDVGAFSNSSGAAGYSNFTAQVVTMEVGKSYSLSLTPGFSGSSYFEYWKIWVDLNGDGIFGANELLFDPGSMSKNTVTGTLTIPSGTALRTTRMRVSMKYNSAATACETFSYGEVEDYTVNIVSAQTVPYCNATTETTLSYYYIEQVVLGSINNTTILGNSSTGYTDYTAISTSLTAGATYPMEVHFYPEWSGNSGKVYIDWNGNGDFGDVGEQVLSASGATTPYTSNIVVPANAVNGPTRMRVRLAHYETITPCGIHDYGETEDYTVNIGQAISDSNMEIKSRASDAAEVDLHEFAVKIFPNPASGQFNLYVAGATESRVQLVSLNGTVVKDFVVNNGQHQISVEGIHPGLYLLTVTTPEHQFVDKLLIK